MNAHPAMRGSRGLTLIETVLFIVIIGIAAVALLGSFGNVLPRSPTPAQMTQASHLAQERMGLILGRYKAVGFTAVNDPCVGGIPPAICTPPAGYAVAVSGVAAPVAWNGNPVTNYKLVTVTATFGGTRLAQENTVLANY